MNSRRPEIRYRRKLLFGASLVLMAFTGSMSVLSFVADEPVLGFACLSGFFSMFAVTDRRLRALRRGHGSTAAPRPDNSGPYQQ